MAIDLVKDSRDLEIAQLKAELEEMKSRPAGAEAPPQGASYVAEAKDDRDLVQKELDTFEEFVINSLFPNGIKVNPFIKTYLTIRGQSEVDVINKAIVTFEQYARPFMSPDGTIILTGKPSELIRVARPLLEQLGKMIGG